MSALIDVALPVFAIMLCGVLAGRAKLMGTDAALALNTFVYWFALPPLLFLGMARAPLQDILNGPFMAVFLTSLFATAGLAIVIVKLFARGTPADSLVQHGLNASFSNTGYMGIPLFLAAFGQNGLAPVILATILISSVVIGVAVTGIEAARAHGQGLGTALGNVAKSLVKNPLVMSPLVGLMVPLLGLPLPRALVTLGDLLGSAASPCALFAIGLFLAGRPLRGVLEPDVILLTVLKLAVQPLIAWALIQWVWPLPPFWAGSCILLAALPTGALTFVVAQRYELEMEHTSTVILVSTIASVATLTAVLTWILPLTPS